MSFDYVESARDALAILKDFSAKVVTVTVAAPPPDEDDYNPATGTGQVLPPIVTYALGVVLDYDYRQNGNQKDANIAAGDRWLIMSALDVNGAAIAPEQVAVDAEILAPDGHTYIVKNPKPFGPAGVVVLYDVTIRRP